MGSSSEGPVLRTLLVVDIADTEALELGIGTDKVQECRLVLHSKVQELLQDGDGRLVETGRGQVLAFERPFEAVVFALHLHDVMADLAGYQGRQLSARIGAHLSEVDLPEPGGKASVPDNTWQFLHMLQTLAQPRQTLLTRGVFDLARRAAVGSDVEALDLQWIAHGSYRVEGFIEPIEIFEVGVEGKGAFTPPAGSEAVRREDDTILGWRPAPGLEVPHRSSWVLRSKIDERSFSEAWLAEHRKTHDTQVFKFCFEEERLRGLQREVTIFRLLKEALGDRKDIARILDWNFDEPPYFVEAEHSKDGTLPEWLQEQGGSGKVPLSDRIAIVAQVADALSAAHSIGVLHKDIKPESILISVDHHGKPRTCLTGFGVGQITEWERVKEAKITVMGFLPEPSAEEDITTSGLFMAPELLEGKTSTVQADIYALGVILYQLVVGDLHRALAPGWHRDIDDELLFDDIAAMVDGRPENRLADAAEAARRLRTLDERRARKRREEEEKRAAEQAVADAQRKRRRTVATVGLVLGAALLLVCFQLWRLSGRLDQLETEAAGATAEAERVQAESRTAQDAVSLFHEALQPGSESGEAARQLLDEGVRQADTELADQPAEHARALCSFGAAYRNLGQFSQAEAVLHRAATVAETIPGDSAQLRADIEHEQATLARLRQLMQQE